MVKFGCNVQSKRDVLIRSETKLYKDLCKVRAATNTIDRFRPVIIFEFKKYFELFENRNYKLFESKSKIPLKMENIERNVPKYGGIDILCLPN